MIASVERHRAIQMMEMTTYTQVLGSVIARRRQELGIGVPDMARRLGMPPSTYAGLEVGLCSCTTRELGRIGQALEVPVSFLVRHADTLSSALRRAGVDVLVDRPASLPSASWAWLGCLVTGVVAVAVSLARPRR